MKSVAAQIKSKLCRVCAAPASGVVVGRYARINAAICGAKSHGILPLPIPPSSWPLCDQAIEAYKAACCKAN